jgi:hypothetical protein
VAEKEGLLQHAQQACAMVYGIDARHWSKAQCLEAILERGMMPSREEREALLAEGRGDNTLSSSPEH